MNKILLGLFIGWMVGGTAFAVGTPRECAVGNYSWWLPLVMAMILSVPAFLGYQIGRGK